MAQSVNTSQSASPRPAEWLPSEVDLPEAWTLVLYTDGLVEGRATPGASERFGAERLRAWFMDGTRAIDSAALQALVTALEEANGGPLPDDVPARNAG